MKQLFEVTLDGVPVEIGQLTLASEEPGYGAVTARLSIRDAYQFSVGAPVRIFASLPRIHGRLGRLLRRIGIDPQEQRTVFAGFVTHLDSNGYVVAEDAVHLQDRMRIDE